MIDLYYINAIQSLRPNSNFSVIDNDYDSIIWNDSKIKPTKTEIDNELIRMKHEWKLNEIRNIRDRLLISTDKYSLPDFPHHTEISKNLWLSYRNELRNITNNLDTTNITIDVDEKGEICINNLNWPTPPS